jgi:hypothetical protein
MYDGYRFRSRLEARWAVFFKTLGVPYEYEKEGYRTGHVWYLPDFWLPEQDCWIEIKGQAPDEQEIEQVSLLARGTKKDVYVFSGPIVLPVDGESIQPNEDGAEVHFWLEEERKMAFDQPYYWCECSICGKVDICFCGWTERLDCRHIKVKGPNRASLRLAIAYAAARSARFEKGNK